MDAKRGGWSGGPIAPERVMGPINIALTVAAILTTIAFYIL